MSNFLFLITSSRRGGNSETLARRAAEHLPPGTKAEWLNLSDYPLPAFDDIRHSGDGTYPAPEGAAAHLFEATLAATDLVFVAPLYWYGLPSAAKLYLDHWSGWMRVHGADFKPRMAGKRMWAVTVYSDVDPRVAQPLFDTLRFTADYMAMEWKGELLGFGNLPGDILKDADAWRRAQSFFSSHSPNPA